MAKPRKKTSKAKPVIAKEPTLMPLESFAEQAYLNYSMYVVRHRALPQLGDGLKPVQRRIVYAMHQLGLSAKSKPKKSARTIGDVLGKFHPHGDSACYEAMVLMAQSFSIRYPLVHGQGNWGSIDDPKSFAAMRYTEANLTAYAGELLSEISKGTVDMQDNFDGSLQEPTCLPARIPNVLLNGSSGIAVGMSTDIPPHNLGEVAKACAAMLRKKTIKLDELLEHIPAPDFPGGCSVLATGAELRELYDKGMGMLKLRAVYHFEGKSVVFTRLPHQVSISSVLAQLRKLQENKKIPMVRHYRDESDQESEVRLVIQLQNSASWPLAQCVSHLLSLTDLECSYRANFNILNNEGRPETMGLVRLLSQWLAWRIDRTTRRINWRLEGIAKDLERIEAYLLIYANLDEIIAIIRKADDPKVELYKRFAYNDFVIETILETKLRQLARLEELALREKAKQLQLEKLALLSYLGKDDKKLRGLVRQEIMSAAKLHQDARRSQIEGEAESANQIHIEKLVPVFDVTVALTRHGWIRGGKASEFNPDNLSIRSGDELVSIIQERSNLQGYCLDQNGRLYSLALSNLPPVRGAGEPVSKHFKCQAGTLWAGMFSQSTKEVVLLSDLGAGFRMQTADLGRISGSGRAFMRAPEGGQVLRPLGLQAEDDFIALLDSEGLLIILEARDIPVRSSGKGVRLMTLQSAGKKQASAKVVAHCRLTAQDSLILKTSSHSKRLTASQWQKYIKNRSRRGSVATAYRNQRATDLKVGGKSGGEEESLFDNLGE